MYEIMEKNEVLQIINKFKEKCHDEYLNMNRLDSYKGIWRICKNLIDDTRVITLTNHAENQILQRLGIPIKYYRSCPQHLKEENFNYWSTRMNKELLFRFYNKTTVRGVLSQRYSTTKDDKDIYPIVLDVIPEGMKIDFFNKGMELSILNLFSGSSARTQDGIEIKTGISIINSEVGSAALTFFPRVILYGWNVVNLNGDGITRIIHVGDLNKERVLEAMIEAEDISEKAAAKLVLVGNLEVPEPMKTTASIFEKYQDIPEELLRLTEEEVKQTERMMTRIELGTIILKCVEGLPKLNSDLRKKLSVQSAVGELLGIFTGTDEVINQLVQIVD